MPPINKPLLRLAAAIHSQFSTRSANEPLIELPTESWQQCVDLVRQIRRAQLRGWHLAAQELRRDLAATIPSIENTLTSLAHRLPRPVVMANTAAVRSIYEDLVAAGQEFEELDYNLRTRWLSVTTEPIVLEGVYLGPFEIRLLWGQPIGHDAIPYRVVAKEPHPAECRVNVTHPHVTDDVLCEGDGRHAIRQALAQGRVLDFFTLVAGILRTYNPESPYVELALWQGRSCSDCGSVVDEDDSYLCRNCGRTVCSGCETSCCGCGDSYCFGCAEQCPACDDSYCRRCLQPCAGCQKRVCSGCLDEQERCSNCHEDQSPEEHKDDSDRSAPDGAEIQPLGLGQTLIPA